ncbi:hypothetical protein AgCh_031194, partial [Apium graveolens]
MANTGYISSDFKSRGIQFLKDPGFRALVGLRDPFDDLCCVEGISIESERLRKARGATEPGKSYILYLWTEEKRGSAEEDFTVREARRGCGNTEELLNGNGKEMELRFLQK